MLDCGTQLHSYNREPVEVGAHTPEVDNTTYSTLANEHGATGNYATGGASITKANMAPTDDDTNNWAYFDITEDVTWASSTITARYATLYNDTHATKGLICQFDFGSDKSSSNGNFTIQFNANGVIRLT